MTLDGILNIDKPSGLTSFAVVARVRRLCGQRRVGHAGTLDPTARGVLPVCVGKATRVVAFLADARKTYHAVVELGVSTDTLDAEGKVIRRGDPSGVSLERFETALGPFRGRIRQIPPMYSAVKHRGQPLYRLARAGVEVMRSARQVEVNRLDMVDWTPPTAALEIECSKGTYIRSLAHDLGEALGCGAYLKALVRLRVGPFAIEDAISLAELEEAFKAGWGQDLLHPLDAALEGLAAVVLGEEDERVVRNGHAIALEGVDGTGLCRAYSSSGVIVCVLRFRPEKGLWQPVKVFSPPCNLGIPPKLCP